jgi:hypothetical protein
MKEKRMLSTLFTNDVRQTLDQFRRSVDQMFDNYYGYSNQPATSVATGERAYTFSPVVEAGWDENYLNLRAILSLSSMASERPRKALRKMGSHNWRMASSMLPGLFPPVSI